MYILKVHLEMFLEIAYSTIAKYPNFFFFFFFFDALKTGQNGKSYIFQEIGIAEIHV